MDTSKAQSLLVIFLVTHTSRVIGYICHSSHDPSVCTVQYSTDLPCSNYMYCRSRSTRQISVTLIHRIDYLHKNKFTGDGCVWES
jgi:hypothetical protein